ncbi:MAG: hypothetical protein IPP88_02530 [Betaproteobacteria bacterium]|nr:hypothetical protein [Betaproteobacteria bacterium]
MFNKIIPISVALFLSAGIAVADQTFHASNDEPSSVMHIVPSTETRTQIDAGRNEATKEPATFHGWRYVNSDTGWELVQHAYEFRNGKWVHADKLGHNPPKPSPASLDQERARKETTKNALTVNGWHGWRYVDSETGWEAVPHAYTFRNGTLVHTD